MQCLKIYQIGMPHISQSLLCPLINCLELFYDVNIFKSENMGIFQIYFIWQESSVSQTEVTESFLVYSTLLGINNSGCNQWLIFTKQLSTISRKDYSSPKERIDKHSSGFIIQWDGKFPRCLWDVFSRLLGAEESMEKDEPGKDTAQQQLMVSPHQTLSSLYHSTKCRSDLATSMMRSSCFFTWWLSMIEDSRAIIHFLRRNMEFSFLRR